MRLYTVGPVEMFDTVHKVRANRNSVPYFRTQEFSDIMLDTDRLLKKFAGTSDTSKTVYLTASGTGAMEAAVMNCFSSNDRLLVINGGGFGQRFCDICEIHGIPFDAVRLEADDTLAEKHLQPFRDVYYTGMLVNIDETSTGQLYDIQLLSEFCKNKNMYLVVDAISSFLCDSFNMDEYGVDLMIASSQKGACISPGLSMIVLNERIVEERILRMNPKSMYFNFKDYFKNFERGQTPFTPAVGICVELNASLHMIDDVGLDNHLKHIAEVAADFRKKALVQLPVTLPNFPLSNAITPILFKEPIAYKVFEILKNKYDIFVNPTGGKLADVSLRIAHIGQTDIKDNDILLKAMRKAVAELS